MSVESGLDGKNAIEKMLIPLGVLFSLLAFILTIIGPGSIMYYVFLSIIENGNLPNITIDALYMTFNAIIALAFFQVYRKHEEQFFLIGAIICGIIIGLAVVSPLFEVSVPLIVTYLVIGATRLLHFLFVFFIGLGMIRLSSSWENVQLISIFSKTIILLAIPRLIIELITSIGLLSSSMPDNILMIIILSNIHSLIVGLIFAIFVLFFMVEANWFNSQNVSNSIQFVFMLIIVAVGRFLLFLGFLSTHTYIIFLTETQITVIVGTILILFSLGYIIADISKNSLPIYYIIVTLIGFSVIVLTVLLEFSLAYLIDGILMIISVLIMHSLAKVESN